MRGMLGNNCTHRRASVPLSLSDGLLGQGYMTQAFLNQREYGAECSSTDTFFLTFLHLRCSEIPASSVGCQGCRRWCVSYPKTVSPLHHSMEPCLGNTPRGICRKAWTSLLVKPMKPGECARLSASVQDEPSVPRSISSAQPVKK